MYHAMGQAAPTDDPNRRNPQGQQPAAQQFQPPIAASPYQQAGSNFGAPASGQPYYDNQQVQSQGYFPQQGGFPAQDGGLAAQMGGMNIGGEVTQPSRTGRKKKDRHAYHALEAPSGSSAAFNGIPPVGTPATAFLDQQTPGHQFSNTAITPAMNQFPAPVNPDFAATNLSAAEEFVSRERDVDGFAPVQASAQGRVNPDEIPSIATSRDAVAPFWQINTYPTMERHIPPPAAIPFVAFDQGNSSPKFTRLSMNSIPSTQASLQSTGLPLGLLLQPLAPLQPGELEIPVLDFGEAGPPRCNRCRAYINPFMSFRNGGNKFVCNMCTYPNDTPPEYFCATTPQGARVDREQRPELMRGTVEFMVPKEYWSKEPVGLRTLFLIDVGQESFNKGYLEAFCEGIKAALFGGVDASLETEGEEVKRKIPLGAKVGFVTFDKEIHFYNCNAALDQAQMIVMPDIEDPFVPLSEGLFVDPYDSKDVIISLLSRLPSIFSHVKNPEPALLPTLNAALAALEKTGGKVVCSIAALPTWGPGRLFLRDDGKLHSAENDKKLFTTEHPGWKKTAEKMVAAGVGVDFFMAAPGGGFLDIATIGKVLSSRVR